RPHPVGGQRGGDLVGAALDVGERQPLARVVEDPRVLVGPARGGRVDEFDEVLTHRDRNSSSLRVTSGVCSVSRAWVTSSSSTVSSAESMPWSSARFASATERGGLAASVVASSMARWCSSGRGTTSLTSPRLAALAA